MDLILNWCDKAFFTPYFYPEGFPESDLSRQFITLLILTTIGGYLLYFFAAGANFILFFDKKLMKHPLFLENQIRKEITVACKSIPLMAILSSITFMLEIHKCPNLYDSIDPSFAGWTKVALSIVSFIIFTDSAIYWIHRILHHRIFYTRLHKTHHLWKVPTPFASHAFHPVDGFIQSSPYHLYPFLLPMNKYVFLILFVGVNFWTVSIHDGNYNVPKSLRNVVNGSAHHTDHHLFYNYNYGQFLTFSDKLFGSYRVPSAFEGDSLLSQILANEHDKTKDKIK